MSPQACELLLLLLVVSLKLSLHFLELLFSNLLPLLSCAEDCCTESPAS